MCSRELPFLLSFIDPSNFLLFQLLGIVIFSIPKGSISLTSVQRYLTSYFHPRRIGNCWMNNNASFDDNAPLVACWLKADIPGRSHSMITKKSWFAISTVLVLLKTSVFNKQPITVELMGFTCSYFLLMFSKVLHVSIYYFMPFDDLLCEIPLLDTTKISTFIGPPSTAAHVISLSKWVVATVHLVCHSPLSSNTFLPGDPKITIWIREPCFSQFPWNNMHSHIHFLSRSSCARRTVYFGLSFQYVVHVLFCFALRTACKAGFLVPAKICFNRSSSFGCAINHPEIE